MGTNSVIRTLVYSKGQLNFWAGGGIVAASPPVCKRSIRNLLTESLPCCVSLKEIKDSNMWVVKLGGSLALSAQLKRWLAVLAHYGRGRLVIVPGGGLFADKVRELQPTIGFDDATAHQMGVLAMEQYGLMLAGIQSGLVPAGTVAQIKYILHGKLVPIWMPSQMIKGDSSIPQNWSVTSDSLSAWLAERCQAQQLILVKSVVLEDILALTASKLAQLGIVDSAFPSFIQQGEFDVYILGRDNYPLLHELLEENKILVGTRVLRDGKV
jgi:aspartokinase-like uncharacterized kinase